MENMIWGYWVFIQYMVLLSILMHTVSEELMPSCLHSPCRYIVNRAEEDGGGIVVKDASSHVMTWSWEVKGGRWNVTYHCIYPAGWYEGMAQFINCSHVLDGKEQAFVSWGSSKQWESNAVPVYANAWNITYNGDVFGFLPTEEGKYIFRVFTRNKKHNPFGNEELIYAPGSCTLMSSNKAQIKLFWLEKNQRNCEETSFNWSWKGNSGKWQVDYKWDEKADKISSSVYYGELEKAESMVIKWELDIPEKVVMYKTSPIKIYNEPAWSMNLSPEEFWGFSPEGEGNWTFQHFSRNLVFQPFTTT